MPGRSGGFQARTRAHPDGNLPRRTFLSATGSPALVPRPGRRFHQPVELKVHLFRPQCLDGIDGNGPARGEVARQHGSADEERRNSRVRHRVKCGDTK